MPGTKASARKRRERAARPRDPFGTCRRTSCSPDTRVGDDRRRTRSPAAQSIA
ncbi:conserved hypothetical protein [Burkholderia pseudomallei MSHR346]|nr:conserved hypothetical protein [Burkholderia pseudomallei MSHR346]